jgi:hypothetical protein
MKTTIAIIEPDTGRWLWSVDTWSDANRKWWEIYHEGWLVAQAYVTSSGRAYKALKPLEEIPESVWQEIPENVREALEKKK